MREDTQSAVSTSAHVVRGRGKVTINVFVPMDERGQPLQADAPGGTPSPIERRRHTRHRYAAEVEIHREQGIDDVDAMTFEISEGGMSAATPNILAIGERVVVRVAGSYHQSTRPAKARSDVRVRIPGAERDDTATDPRPLQRVTAVLEHVGWPIEEEPEAGRKY